LPQKTRTQKFMTLETREGDRVAVCLDLIERAAFVRPVVPGLLDEWLYLRLYLGGGYVNVAKAEEARVLDALGIKDLAEQEIPA
jgi:hypothetical protein